MTDLPRRQRRSKQERPPAHRHHVRETAASRHAAKWGECGPHDPDAALLEQAACGTSGPTSGLVGHVSAVAGKSPGHAHVTVRLAPSSRHGSLRRRSRGRASPRSVGEAPDGNHGPHDHGDVAGRVRDRRRAGQRPWMGGTAGVGEHPVGSGDARAGLGAHRSRPRVGGSARVAGHRSWTPAATGGQVGEPTDQRWGEARWVVFNPAQVIQVSEPDR